MHAGRRGGVRIVGRSTFNLDNVLMHNVEGPTHDAH